MSYKHNLYRLPWFQSLYPFNPVSQNISIVWSDCHYTLSIDFCILPHTLFDRFIIVMRQQKNSGNNQVIFESFLIVLRARTEKYSTDYSCWTVKPEKINTQNDAVEQPFIDSFVILFYMINSFHTLIFLCKHLTVSTTGIVFLQTSICLSHMLLYDFIR